MPQSDHRSVGRFVTRRFVSGLVVGLGVAGGSLVMAAWTSSGTGSSYSKAGTVSALVLGDASGSTTADLVPGATGAAYLRITNPNGFAVSITTVTRTGAITSDKGAACDATTGVSFANQTGLSQTVAAGATATITLSGAVSMSNASDNSCQGALFTIPVSVTGTSA